MTFSRATQVMDTLYHRGMSCPRGARGALTAVLFALAARAAPAAEEPPLRFAWPVPSHVRITETIEKRGRTAVLRYLARLAPRSDRRLELRLSGVEFVRSPLPGVAPPEMAAEGLLDALQPTLVLSRDGQLDEVVGYERAIELALALVRKSVSDPQTLKAAESLVRSPQMTAALKRKSGEFWELWVGVWAGAELRPGEEFTAEITLPMPDGTTVKQPTTVKHLGPDLKVKGHVRLSLEGTLEGPEFTAVMSRFITGLLRDAQAKDVPATEMFTGIRRETRLSVLTEASTLRPREARSEVTTTVTVKGGERRTQVERRHYRFDWQDRPSANP